jgi:pyruvate dehydrogenase E1 component alpha subunit
VREALLLSGVAAADLDGDEEAAEAEMAAAFDEAREAPFPPAEAAFTDVQDVGSPRQRAF